LLAVGAELKVFRYLLLGKPLYRKMMFGNTPGTVKGS